jgi:sugar lactone lactonase YvrE/preprotein translocase subunit YajC
MTDKIKDSIQEAKESIQATSTEDLKTDSSPLAGDAATLRVTAANTDDKAIKRTRTVATAILIILILIILAACLMMFALLRPQGLDIGGRQHAGITWIRSIYGHGATLDDLMNPNSVSFSADGESFWITDTARHRLVQYDVNGRLIRIINADWRENEMIAPTRVAVSPKGWHYVAEQTYNRVHIFDEDWNHQETIAIEAPNSVTANDDRLLIGGRGGFAVFTYDGQPIGMHAGDSEDEVNHFDSVAAAALDEDNNAFVLDAFNNRFVKYDAEGVPLFEVNLGHPGNAGILGGRDLDAADAEENFPANMQVPQGMALDGNGRLYIIDMLDFSVAVFYADTGEFIKKVGIHGHQDGRFLNPNCLDYNPSLDMFASAEASLGRVQLFAIEGSGGGPLQEIRRNLGDFIDACLIPLIIILIIIAAYIISRILAKKRREKETSAALKDPDLPNGVAKKGVSTSKDSGADAAAASLTEK